MFKIQTFDNIAVAGLERLPRPTYEVASEMLHPDAVLLRSHNLHGWALPETLKAIGRAGAGVNNIPVAECSKRGIAVFNAPGANANAVKELVIAGMLLAARHICDAWQFAGSLSGTDAEIHQQVEKNKKRYAGIELAGKTLGVLGLGAIGVRVANSATALGMHVSGFDPALTVERAWQLSSATHQGTSVDDVLGRSDFVSLHVPLVDQTRHLVNAARLASMREGAVLLNFSREGIVDETAVLDALKSRRLKAYVTDFPSATLLGHPGVIALPHLGASTEEAEENCAVMVANQLRDFLENGNLRNAVNFPEVVMPRTEGFRLSVVNLNVPNMVSQISSCLAAARLNILDLLNKSRGEYAYTLIDVNDPIDEAVIDRIQNVAGVLAVRRL